MPYGKRPDLRGGPHTYALQARMASMLLRVTRLDTFNVYVEAQASHRWLAQPVKSVHKLRLQSLQDEVEANVAKPEHLFNPPLHPSYLAAMGSA